MIIIVWIDSKTTVPQVNVQILERQRLVDLLQSNGPRKLTIVRAPAGYGKTTLLSQWMSQFDEPVVWLSIDTADNDPARFWKYVIRTVSDKVSHDGNSKLLSLFNEQSPLEGLIDSFLNEIESIQGRIHIVIDDYHLVENPVIHEMMIRFIDYLSGNACVYVSSRTELALPLAKWRVKGWLTEIGVEQLRFTYEEVERFYKKQRSIDENTESLQHIVGMTEGWAAGIQLVSLAGRTSTAGEWAINSFDGKHPFVTEFLLQEILASLSPTTQDFLVRTSILNQLEPAICDALTNRTDSYQTLLELEKKVCLLFVYIRINQFFAIIICLRRLCKLNCGIAIQKKSFPHFIKKWRFIYVNEAILFPRLNLFYRGDYMKLRMRGLLRI